MNITCSYCEVFQNCRKDLRKMKTIEVSEKVKKLISERFCRVVTEFVFSDTTGCDKIVRANKFWCDKWNCWIFFSVCLGRQRNQSSCTKSCSQKAIIRTLSRIGTIPGLRKTEHKAVKLGDGKGRKEL